SSDVCSSDLRRSHMRSGNRQARHRLPCRQPRQRNGTPPPRLRLRLVGWLYRRLAIVKLVRPSGGVVSPKNTRLFNESKLGSEPRRRNGAKRGERRDRLDTGALGRGPLRLPVAHVEGEHVLVAWRASLDGNALDRLDDGRRRGACDVAVEFDVTAASTARHRDDRAPRGRAILNRDGALELNRSSVGPLDPIGADDMLREERV